MTKHNVQTDTMAAVIRLQGVQRKLDELRRERDLAICALDGSVGVRELARFLDLSPAQVSRIRTRAS